MLRLRYALNQNEHRNRMNQLTSSLERLHLNDPDPDDTAPETLNRLSRQAALQNPSLQNQRENEQLSQQPFQKPLKRKRPDVIPAIDMDDDNVILEETSRQPQPPDPRFLLPKISSEVVRSEEEQEKWETERADRSLFVQELFFSMISDMGGSGTPTAAASQPAKPKKLPRNKSRFE